MQIPTVGQAAPAFSLSDQTGRMQTLEGYKGSYTLLYFYPADMSSGCTLEAEGFRDAYEEYKKRGITIVGISPDSVESHGTFCTSSNLPFTLLADTEHVAADAYGVWGERTFEDKKYMGIERSSFLIDPKGILIKEWRNVDPVAHPQEVLSFFDALEK